MHELISLVGVSHSSFYLSHWNQILMVGECEVSVDIPVRFLVNGSLQIEHRCFTLLIECYKTQHLGHKSSLQIENHKDNFWVCYSENVCFFVQW